MFKSILVHVSGSKADKAVLDEAVNIAGLFDAHLECVHVRPGMAQLAQMAAQGALGDSGVNLVDTLRSLQKAGAENARKARETFDAYCKKQGIASADAPTRAGGLSAAFREVEGEDADTLTGEARSNDIAVLAGGGSKAGLLARDLAQVLTRSGRPLVLTPSAPPKRAVRNIAVAWKDSAESARALSAAMPLLVKAAKVLVLAAGESAGDATARQKTVKGVIRHLRWHGIAAEWRHLSPGKQGAPEAVLAAAASADADLLVMGAYGRGRLTEIVFGGFTQRVLKGADLPVFLLH